MATRYEQAVRGIESGIALSSDVARVRDGNDTWLCTRAAWDAARVKLGGLAPISGDEDEGGMHAYSELCTAAARESGPVVSLHGSGHGTQLEQARLVAVAVRDGLLDPDEPLVERALALDLTVSDTLDPSSAAAIDVHMTFSLHDQEGAVTVLGMLAGLRDGRPGEVTAVIGQRLAARRRE